MTTETKTPNTRTPHTSNNADAAEIAKFDQLAHTWWDKSGDCKPLHDINPLRCNYIDEWASVLGATLCDVGCGGGIVAEALAQRGAKVTGIDLSTEALQVAKLHALESGLSIDYQHSSAEAFAEQHAGHFDTVTCLEMLEHVPDPSRVIESCIALLKPGGTLILSTINRTPKAYAGMILGAEYLLKWIPKGTHEYGKFIRPSEIASSLRTGDMDLLDMTGLTYQPLLRQYQLKPRDLAINYLVCARKPSAVNEP